MSRIPVCLCLATMALCAPAIHAAGLSGDSVTGTFAFVVEDSPGVPRTIQADLGTRTILDTGTSFSIGEASFRITVSDNAIRFVSVDDLSFRPIASARFVDNTKAIPGVYSLTSTDIPVFGNDVISVQGNTFSLNLGGLDIRGGRSATFTLNPLVSAVPEPETYAMLLAGMALVAALTRRKNTVLAAR